MRERDFGMGFEHTLLVCGECGARADRSGSCCPGCGASEDGGSDISGDGEKYEAPARRWSLYLFVDPRTETVIYVGITCDPHARARAHRHSSESAVKEWSLVNGVEPRMVEVAKFPTYEMARSAEERLIATLPSLANRDVEFTKRRLRHLWAPRKVAA